MRVLDTERYSTGFDGRTGFEGGTGMSSPVLDTLSLSLPMSCSSGDAKGADTDLGLELKGEDWTELKRKF